MSAKDDDPLRIGSFADGQTTVPEPSAPAARFCNGQEQRHDKADLREGGFADGQALLTVAVHARGRFSTGQDRRPAQHTDIAGRARHPPPRLSQRVTESTAGGVRPRQTLT